MKLTTFLSLLSAVFSIAASCYTIIRFMDNNKAEKKNVQEVNEVGKEDHEENTEGYQKLIAEDDQDDIHQDIYQYIKKSQEEEENKIKKEKSQSKRISLFMRCLSSLIEYLLLVLVIVFLIKNRPEYVKKIVQKDIVPTEIKKILKGCRQDNVSENENKGTELSLFEKNILFDLDERFSQPFFMEIGLAFLGFCIFTALLEEVIISLVFALFKDQKKSFFRRWKEVVLSLKEMVFDKLPPFIVVGQMLNYFVNILISYFVFRIVVYSVNWYNNREIKKTEVLDNEVSKNQ